MPLDPSEDLLTVEETAQLLRCSLRTVYRQVANRTLPGLIVIGPRLYRIDRARLLAGGPS